jgi:hypothetical protein
LETAFAICLVAVLVVLAFALHSLAWRRAPREVRLPLAVYTIAYFITSFLGGAAYGLFGADVLDELEYGLDLTVLRSPPGFTYWTVLFAPLVVPPLCVLALLGRRSINAPRSARALPRPQQVGLLAFLLVFCGFTGYCLFALFSRGYLGAVFFWQDFKGDFLTLLSLRSEMFGALPGKFFGLVYITLPALSHCALYQALATRSSAWWGCFLAAAVVVVYLSLAVIQKSLVLVYLAFLGMHLVDRGILRARSLVINFLLVLVLLTVLQSFFLDDWELTHSALLLIFRVGVSWPFYLEVYPTLEPFHTVDIGLSYLGLVEPPRDNLDVFNHMYPTVTWIQGAAAAPAHVRAYAQGGLVLSLLTTVAVGAAIALVAQVKRRARGPLSFTLYIQSLVFLYYLTQVGLIDALLTSYGLIWSLAAVGGLWAASALGDLQPTAPALARSAPGTQPVH